MRRERLGFLTKAPAATGENLPVFNTFHFFVWKTR